LAGADPPDKAEAEAEADDADDASGGAGAGGAADIEQTTAASRNGL